MEFPQSDMPAVFEDIPVGFLPDRERVSHSEQLQAGGMDV